MKSTLAFALLASFVLSAPAAQAGSRAATPLTGTVRFNCVTTVALHKVLGTTRFKFGLNVQDPEQLSFLTPEVPFANGKPPLFDINDLASPLRALNVDPEVELNRDFNLSIWANYYNNYFVTVTLERTKSHFRSGTVLIEDGGSGIKEQEVPVRCRVEWHDEREEFATLAAFEKLAKTPPASSADDEE